MTTTTPLNDELFELCKAVYEKTGWGNYYEPDAGIYDWRQDKRKKRKLTVESYSELDRDKDAGVFFEGGYPTWVAPLYTSDYLLEKLLASFPANIYETRLTTGVIDSELGMKWRAESKGDGRFYKVYEADTPLKALLKLALALSKAGEL